MPLPAPRTLQVRYFSFSFTFDYDKRISRLRRVRNCNSELWFGFRFVYCLLLLIYASTGTKSFSLLSVTPGQIFTMTIVVSTIVDSGSDDYASGFFQDLLPAGLRFTGDEL
jgi:hypothetical protein